MPTRQSWKNNEFEGKLLRRRVNRLNTYVESLEQKLFDGSISDKEFDRLTRFYYHLAVFTKQKIDLSNDMDELRKKIDYLLLITGKKKDEGKILLEAREIAGLLPNRQ